MKKPFSKGLAYFLYFFVVAYFSQAQSGLWEFSEMTDPISDTYVFSISTRAIDRSTNVSFDNWFSLAQLGNEIRVAFKVKDGGFHSASNEVLVRSGNGEPFFWKVVVQEDIVYFSDPGEFLKMIVGSDRLALRYLRQSGEEPYLVWNVENLDNFVRIMVPGLLPD